MRVGVGEKEGEEETARLLLLPFWGSHLVWQRLAPRFHSFFPNWFSSQKANFSISDRPWRPPCHAKVTCLILSSASRECCSIPLLPLWLFWQVQPAWIRFGSAFASLSRMFVSRKNSPRDVKCAVRSKISKINIPEHVDFWTWKSANLARVFRHISRSDPFVWIFDSVRWWNLECPKRRRICKNDNKCALCSKFEGHLRRWKISILILVLLFFIRSLFYTKATVVFSELPSISSYGEEARLKKQGLSNSVQEILLRKMHCFALGLHLPLPSVVLSIHYFSIITSSFLISFWRQYLNLFLVVVVGEGKLEISASLLCLSFGEDDEIGNHIGPRLVTFSSFFKHHHSSLKEKGEIWTRVRQLIRASLCNRPSLFPTTPSHLPTSPKLFQKPDSHFNMGLSVSRLLSGLFGKKEMRELSLPSKQSISSGGGSRSRSSSFNFISSTASLVTKHLCHLLKIFDRISLNLCCHPFCCWGRTGGQGMG